MTDVHIVPLKNSKLSVSVLNRVYPEIDPVGRVAVLPRGIPTAVLELNTVTLVRNGVIVSASMLP